MRLIIARVLYDRILDLLLWWYHCYILPLDWLRVAPSLEPLTWLPGVSCDW
jgi:hypothetical protein